MLSSTPKLQDYWNTLADVLPKFTPQEQRTAVALYRELAKGVPLKTEGVASALGVSLQDAREALAKDRIRALIHWDKDQIVGFGGLATVPMHHELRVNGQTLWTWCAWDSLFIPAILGETGDVSSPDPETNEVVRLTVSPSEVVKAEPADSVVTFLLPDDASFNRSASNVMATFCHYVFFFASRDAGERWQAKRENTFLHSLDEAFELGQKLVHKLFGSVLGQRPA